MIKYFKNVREERQENQKILRELSKENGQYYLDFLKNLLTFTDMFSKDDRAVDILPDILQDQESGLSAKEFFGLEPEELAGQMVKQLPDKINYRTIFLDALGAFVFALCLLVFLKFTKAQEFSYSELFLGAFIISLANLLSEFVEIWLNKLLIDSKPKTRETIVRLVRLLIIVGAGVGFLFLLFLLD